jgi:hypothetical protein
MKLISTEPIVLFFATVINFLLQEFIPKAQQELETNKVRGMVCVCVCVCV